MKRSTWIGILFAILAAGACCALAAVLILLAARSDLLLGWVRGGSGERALLAIPDRRGEADLVLLRMGQTPEQGVLLAEQARPGAGSLVEWIGGQDLPVGSPDFAGFVGGGELALVQFEIDGETSVSRIRQSGREATTVFESDASRFDAFVRQDGDRIFLVESADGGSMRCYLSRAGEIAERVARADSCELSLDGSTMLVSDGDADGLTLTLSSYDGADETILVEDIPGVRSFQLAPDGSRVAYVDTVGDDLVRLTVLGRDGGVLFESGDAYGILTYGFAPAGDGLFYIAEEEDGDLSLSTQHGQVTSAPTLDAGFSPSGEALIYLEAGAEGDGAVSTYSLAEDREQELVEGEDLAFAVVSSPDRVIVRTGQGDDLTVYSADPDGDDVIELFDDRGYYLQTAQVLPGGDTVYLILQEAGGSISLYVSSLGTGEGSFVLEDWTEIEVLNRSLDGEQLLVAGREDGRDPLAVLLIDLGEDGEAIVLDESAEAVSNAVFAPRGRQVYFTAATGPDSDEVEVRRVEADGSRPAEVIYAGAELVDVAWDELEPFRVGYLTFLTGMQAEGMCPGAALLTEGEPLRDELEPGGERCYRLRVTEALEWTISVLADNPDLDARMYLYDRSGGQIAEDDDGGPGVNPRLRQTFDAPGLYYVFVRGFSEDDAGPYSIELRAGIGSDGFSQAEPLSYDAVAQGMITREAEIFIEPFDASLFGVMYTFEGTALDWIQVDVDEEAGGAREQMIGIILFSPAEEFVATGTAGSPGTDLQYSLPSSGAYYLLVGLLNEEIPVGDLFFDISLTRGTPPEPGGGPISYGDTREAFVFRQEGDAWTFQGVADEEVTVTMRSGSIDSVLTLLGPDGIELIFDDDGAGYPDAMILGFRLPVTGEYTIVARSLGGNSGDYTLSLALGAPGETGEIERGQTVEGELALASRDRWTFNGEQGDVISVVMTSTTFDTYLELYGPDGEMLAANDDSPTTSRSEISEVQLPETGQYTIVARAYSSNGSGPYELSLR